MDSPPDILQTFRLDGRAALVTGGSRGLGEAIGLALAQAGADVALASRGRDEVEQTAGRIAATTGRNVFGTAADVRAGADCERLVREALARFGRLDILVNSAGVNVRKPILDMSEAEFTDLIDINLTGSWRMAKAVGPTFTGQGSGRVVNLSSILDEVTIPGRTGYAASKGGVRMLTRTLALEWGPLGVRVNAVSPGPFATPMNRPLLEDERLRAEFARKIPVGRWGEPWEVGAAVVYLASPASDFVNGTMLYIDGGWTAQ